MKLKGSVKPIWRILLVALCLTVSVILFFGILMFINSSFVDGDQWIKWPLAIFLFVIATTCLRFPFKGICEFDYNENVLSTKNLVTGKIKQYNISEIEIIDDSSHHKTIFFKDGKSINLGLWDVSNVDELIAQLIKDIKQNTIKNNISALDKEQAEKKNTFEELIIRLAIVILIVSFIVHDLKRQEIGIMTVGFFFGLLYFLRPLLRRLYSVKKSK